MRFIRFYLFVTICFALVSPGFSQLAICSDGVDNDFDGKIDANDLDCDYGFPFGDVLCAGQVPPPPTMPNMAQIQLGLNNSDTPSKLVVGDLDMNDIPEFVVTSKWNASVKVIATRKQTINSVQFNPGDILSSFTLTDKKSLFTFDLTANDPCYPDNLVFEHEVFIADIDKDHTSEIFAIVSNRKVNINTPPTCYYLIGFVYQLGNLTVIPGYPKRIGSDSPGVPGITDFDGDGLAEIYFKNRIYAAENGALLADDGGDWDSEINSSPVAANILSTDTQELICGNLIYYVPNLSARTQQTLTVVSNMNSIAGLPESKKYFPKVYNDPIEYGISNHSSTAVADMDNDGNIDVLISGAINSASGQTAVFYWNVAKSKVSVFVPPDPSDAKGWAWGTGRLNIADIDGDEQLNVNFTAGNQLFSLKVDAQTDELSSNWTTPQTINGGRTGLVGCTTFDFNGDGGHEIVYRDSQELVVLQGYGQFERWSSSCLSHAYTEAPIIADANGDGATDICVPCFSYPTGFTVDDPLRLQAQAAVKLFYSEERRLLPTRGVWNQPNYFVTHISDNLTIPLTQFPINGVFSMGTCTQFANKPLNSYLNQIPFMNRYGCPSYVAPNLTFIAPLLTLFRDPLCGDSEIQFTFSLENIGDVFYSGELKIGLFNGDPRLPGSTLLFKDSLDIIKVDPKDMLRYPSTGRKSINAPIDPFDLFIVFTEGSLTIPFEGSHYECDYNSNIFEITVPGVFGAKDIGQDRFTIGWINTTAGVNQYQLDVSTNPAFTDLLPGFDKKVIASTSTSQEVTGLASGTLYHYRLYAQTDQGTALICSAREQITVPANPTLSPVTTVTDHGFTAKWDGLKGSEFYEVDISTDGFATFFPGYQSKKIVNANQGPINQVLSDLSAGTDFSVRLRAGNSAGVSGNSVPQLFSTTGTFAPMRVSVSPNSADQSSGEPVKVKFIVKDGIGNYVANTEYRLLSEEELYPVDHTRSLDTVTVLVEKYMLDELGVEVSLHVTDELGQMDNMSARVNYVYLAVNDLKIVISPPYPNPSSGDVYCQVTLPDTDKRHQVSFQILDHLGRSIQFINSFDLMSGTQTVHWDRKDYEGNAVNPGLFLIQVSVDGVSQKNYRVILR